MAAQPSETFALNCTITDRKECSVDKSDYLQMMRLLAESQAREAKLRDAMNDVFRRCALSSLGQTLIKEALALPTDDTTLKETLKAEYERGYDSGFLVGAEKGRNFSEEFRQAKRDALMKAADWFATRPSSLLEKWPARELRHRAEELE